MFAAIIHSLQMSTAPLRADGRVDRALANDLSALARLIANATEAYSAVIFLRTTGEDELQLAACHTLSREFRESVRIAVGSGLVGWVAQNGLRLSVCPFEHNSTTLGYYSADQELKSFLAVPIQSADRKTIGVLACDSRKSYAFTKVAEKILQDCAGQAARLVALHAALVTSPIVAAPARGVLEELIGQLQHSETEDDLLTKASAIPSALIERESLVLLSLAEGGVGEARFYRSDEESASSSRLLDLVCQHKRLISAERVVHSQPADDSRKRSFLSVPFQVLAKEAGSFNLLSRPNEAFRCAEIAALEQIAAALGRELERIRLREAVAQLNDHQGVSWNRFLLQSKRWLVGARRDKTALTLLRFSLDNLDEIERAFGVGQTLAGVQGFQRLIAQVSGQSALSCGLHGSHVVVLTPTTEVSRITKRLERLLNRPPESVSSPSILNDFLSKGLRCAAAEFPGDGHNIEELVRATVQRRKVAETSKPAEVAVHDWHW